MIPALCPSVVDCFRPDGSLVDLARPMVEEIDFCAIAGSLSRIARFNGNPDCIAFSVAQHSVMGTEALLNEGHDEITAALFLLHDAHEHFIGDKTRPFQTLLIEMLAHRAGRPVAVQLGQIIRDMKSGWDAAIFAAANLPTPGAWTNRQKAAVSLMDDRMVLAESTALFGPQAAQNIKRSPGALKAPSLTLKGSLKPWGAMKAEEAFLKLFIKLRGEELLQDVRMQHAIHVSTAGKD